MAYLELAEFRQQAQAAGKLYELGTDIEQVRAAQRERRQLPRVRRQGCELLQYILRHDRLAHGQAQALEPRYGAHHRGCARLAGLSEAPQLGVGPEVDTLKVQRLHSRKQYELSCRTSQEHRENITEDKVWTHCGHSKLNERNSC